MSSSVWKILAVGVLGCCCLGKAADMPLTVKKADDFKKSFEIVNGDWTAGDQGVTGVSPRYHDLPGTALEGMGDDAHTYFVVHAINLWRYAIAGSTNWDNYTFETTVKILDPAPLKGVRPGQDCVFMNYQWGREAMGSDAAIVVRYAGPDRNYMVRLSSGFGHVELWKTKGGVVRVVPFTFAANTEYKVSVTAAGRWIVVAIDGKELIRYCDTVDPIETGKAGLAVRESKVQFSDIRVTSVAAITDKAPVHKPDFKIKSWVGRQYIFDGNEPIAHFARPDAPLLEEVKFVPGVMPFCTLPGAPSWGIDWKSNVVFRVVRDGSRLDWTWTMEERNGQCKGTSTWRLEYDPKIGYVWDHKAKLTALVDDKQRWAFDLTDPCFYQTVAPATGKMPACRTNPNFALWQRNDGQYSSFPANHQFKDGGGISEVDRQIKSGGFWVTTVDDWATVFELPSDNSYQYVADYCHWGLDQHILPSSVGPDGKVLSRKAAKKGEVYEGHVRVYAFPPAKLKEMLAKSTLPPSARNDLLTQPMLVHEEPVNHFNETVNAVAGDSKVRWLGTYTIDNTVGHGDSTSMRIDGTKVGPKGRGENPWLEIGSSYRTGPYTGMRYRIGMWVKADNFKGKVAIKARDFNWPVKRDFPEQKAELEIKGKCDWTHVSFESDFPRLAHLWKLSINVEGEGDVWVDDVEIMPLESK